MMVNINISISILSLVMCIVLIYAIFSIICIVVNNMYCCKIVTSSRQSNPVKRKHDTDAFTLVTPEVLAA